MEPIKIEEKEIIKKSSWYRISNFFTKTVKVIVAIFVFVIVFGFVNKAIDLIVVLLGSITSLHHPNLAKSIDGIGEIFSIAIGIWAGAECTKKTYQYLSFNGKNDDLVSNLFNKPKDEKQKSSLEKL